jgi:hypothetical protein
LFCVFNRQENEKDLDEGLAERLALSRCGPSHCVLLGRGFNASFCLSERRWRSSARLTALHMTASLALLFVRLRAAGNDVTTKTLLASTVSKVLAGCSKPDVKGPSLAVLVTFWQVCFVLFVCFVCLFVLYFVFVFCDIVLQGFLRGSSGGCSCGVWQQCGAAIRIAIERYSASL